MTSYEQSIPSFPFSPRILYERPDVTRPSNETDVLSADIEITDGTSNQTIHYQIGKQCSELASFYVFDSTSVRVHLNESNSLSFSPAGLSYLTQLAEVTDEVRKRLRDKIENFSQPHDFSAIFQGESEVGELIADLGPNTDLNKLRQMATLSPEQEEQIGELDIQIARLKAQDISKQISNLSQQVSDLENLNNQLREIQEKLNEKVFEDILNALRDFLNQQEIAQQVSADQFKTEHFTQTGSDVWYEFISAAKRLANAEQSEEEPYPQANSRCLLCQQPLSVEARDLLLRLWTFLEEEAQAKLQETQTTLEEKLTALDKLDLDFFDAQSVSHRYLQENNPPLLEKVKLFVTNCRKQRETARQYVKLCVKR